MSFHSPHIPAIFLFGFLMFFEGFYSYISRSFNYYMTTLLKMGLGSDRRGREEVDGSALVVVMEQEGKIRNPNLGGTWMPVTFLSLT